MQGEYYKCENCGMTVDGNSMDMSYFNCKRCGEILGVIAEIEELKEEAGIIEDFMEDGYGRWHAGRASMAEDILEILKGEDNGNA